MAISHPLVTLQRTFGRKPETTNGTDVTPAAADCVLNYFDPKIEFRKGNAKLRQGQYSYSKIKVAAGARAADVTFGFELHGASASGGTVACDGILKAAGLALSGSTYTVASGSATAPTDTCALWQDGSRLRKAAGVMYNLVFGGRRGEPCMVQATGVGAWVAPTTDTMPTPTYETVALPILLDATFTIGGTEYEIDGFELDLGNSLYLRESINAASGFVSSVITNREPHFRISPEAKALGTKDFYADFVANTTAAISLAFGSAAGNTWTFAMPAAQLVDGPEDGDREGVFTDVLDFVAVRVAGGLGDTELTIVRS